MVHNNTLLWLLIHILTLSVVNSDYYSFNGTGNNLANPHWGSKNTPYIRLPKIRFLSTEDLSTLISPRNLSNFLSYGQPKATEVKESDGRMTLLGLS